MLASTAQFVRRAILPVSNPTVDGTRSARRARSTGRDADDGWMSARTIEPPTDRWGDREVEGVSSIVES